MIPLDFHEQHSGVFNPIKRVSEFTAPHLFFATPTKVVRVALTVPDIAFGRLS